MEGLAESPEERRRLDLLAAQQYTSDFRIVTAAARQDFKTYLQLFNPPETNFVLSSFHEYLAELVQDIVDGRASLRQAISVPPQHGKTQILSKEAGSWLMGRFPGLDLAITSHSADLCVEISQFIRDRIRNPFYRLVFPDTDIVYGSNRMDNWRLTNGSRLRAKPAGSKFTGRRIDWLIVDDPHKGREEAESKLQREAVTKWYFADLYTRLSPGACVEVIQTRFHPQDLVGSLTDPERVEQLIQNNAVSEVFTMHSLPAICEDPDNDLLCREEGEPLFPEVRDAQFLHNAKMSIPIYDWESQFQQRPRLGGGDVDVTKLQYINWEQLPDNLELVRHWDLALTENQTSDWTAGAMCAYDADEDKFYIAHMFRNRKNWVKNRKHIIERALRESETYQVHRIGVEAVAGFLAAYQDLRASLIGDIKVIPVHPSRGGKMVNATPWMNKLEAGRVFLVRAPWNRDFVEELQGFPDGEHDDQIDAVSGAFSILTGRNKFTAGQKKTQRGAVGRGGWVRPATQMRTLNMRPANPVEPRVEITS